MTPKRKCFLLGVVSLTLPLLAIYSCIKVLSGKLEIYPPETWSKTLPSGSTFEFTYQLVNHTGWGGDSGGRTTVAYYPLAGAQPEYVGELFYPLMPERFSKSTVMIYESDDVILFGTSNKAFIRRAGQWNLYAFLYNSFPGQNSRLVEGKVNSSPTHRGSFKLIGVEANVPALKVLYMDALGSWVLRYAITDDDEALALLNVQRVNETK